MHRMLFIISVAFCQLICGKAKHTTSPFIFFPLFVSFHCSIHILVSCLSTTLYFPSNGQDLMAYRGDCNINIKLDICFHHCFLAQLVHGTLFLIFWCNSTRIPCPLPPPGGRASMLLYFSMHVRKYKG